MILFPKVVVKHSGTVCSAHTNEPIEVNISLPVARTRRSRDNINSNYKKVLVLNKLKKMNREKGEEFTMIEKEQAHAILAIFSVNLSAI